MPTPTQRSFAHSQAALAIPTMFRTSSSTSLIPWALIQDTYPQSLITTTSCIAGSASTLVTGTQEMPLNIYSIFVGPPTTRKSQAIKECAVSPMVAVVRETDSSCPVRYTMCYLNYWSPTKRTPLETCKFCVSYFLERKLPTGTPQKERARLHQTRLSPYLVLHKFRLPPALSRS